MRYGTSGSRVITMVGLVFDACQARGHAARNSATWCCNPCVVLFWVTACLFRVVCYCGRTAAVNGEGLSWGETCDNTSNHFVAPLRITPFLCEANNNRPATTPTFSMFLPMCPRPHCVLGYCLTTALNPTAKPEGDGGLYIGGFSDEKLEHHPSRRQVHVLREADGNDHRPCSAQGLQGGAKVRNLTYKGRVRLVSCFMQLLLLLLCRPFLV